MTRILDIIFSLFLFLIFIIPILIISILIFIYSPGSVLFWSRRIGRDNIVFHMPKFRTMKLNAPDVATHLLKDSSKYITKIGYFLRKKSLDELPQLWSILIGDMTFIGPRPALYNQNDLIDLRTKYGIHKLKPGITGLAQISGRDSLAVKDKVDFDLKYLNEKSLTLNIKIIYLTLLKVLRNEGIKH